jgi:hypothetical protein
MYQSSQAQETMTFNAPNTRMSSVPKLTVLSFAKRNGVTSSETMQVVVVGGTGLEPVTSTV